MSVRAFVDTSRVTLIAGGVGAPVVKDWATGEVAQTKQGDTVFAVNLVVFTPGEETPQTWKVKVAGEPKGIVQGQPVKVSDLVLTDWSMDDGKHGVSFRAASITPLVTSSAKAAA